MDRFFCGWCRKGGAERPDYEIMVHQDDVGDFQESTILGPASQAARRRNLINPPPSPDAANNAMESRRSLPFPVSKSKITGVHGSTAVMPVPSERIAERDEQKVIYAVVVGLEHTGAEDKKRLHASSHTHAGGGWFGVGEKKTEEGGGSWFNPSSLPLLGGSNAAEDAGSKEGRSNKGSWFGAPSVPSLGEGLKWEGLKSGIGFFSFAASRGDADDHVLGNSGGESQVEQQVQRWAVLCFPGELPR